MFSQAQTGPNKPSGPARLAIRRLAEENRRFRGTGGVSQRNRNQGFAPAFLDHSTGRVYRSRFASGAPAPVHMLEGLPEQLVERSPDTGQILSALHRVESGFVRFGRFFTRQEAAAAVAESAA